MKNGSAHSVELKGVHYIQIHLKTHSHTYNNFNLRIKNSASVDNSGFLSGPCDILCFSNLRRHFQNPMLLLVTMLLLLLTASCDFFDDQEDM